MKTTTTVLESAADTTNAGQGPATETVYYVVPLKSSSSAAAFDALGDAVEMATKELKTIESDDGIPPSGREVVISKRVTVARAGYFRDYRTAIIVVTA